MALTVLYAKILERLVLNKYSCKHKTEYVINNISFVDSRTVKKQNFVNSLYLKAVDSKLHQQACAHYIHLPSQPARLVHEATLSSGFTDSHFVLMGLAFLRYELSAVLMPV